MVIETFEKSMTLKFNLFSYHRYNNLTQFLQPEFVFLNFTEDQRFIPHVLN